MTILELILDSQCGVSLNHEDVCHCVSKSQLSIMMGLIRSFLFFVARSVISQSFRHVKFRCWDVAQKQGRWTLTNTFLAFFLLCCFSVNDRNLWLECVQWRWWSWFSNSFRNCQRNYTSHVPNQSNVKIILQLFYILCSRFSKGTVNLWTEQSPAQV